MSTWLSRTLIVAAAFAVCWLGAIAYWRDTNSMPGAGDLVLYLLALPLLLVLVVWGVSKLVKAVKAGAPAAAAGAAAGTAAAEAPAAPAMPALNALAGALRMPHGDNPAALGATLLARKANLALDPELTNDSGYPILSGRVEDADPAAQQEAMADWLRAHHPQVDFSDEQWRALSLGTAVAADLAMELAAHPALPAWLDALDARKPLPALATLQLVAVVPPEWQDAERAAALDWLRTTVAQGWPAERLLTPLAHPGQPPLSLVSALAAQARSDEQPFLCLLLACGSQIGHASADDLARRGALFDSDHPNGRIPGEGAAGLLLADGAQGALFDDIEPVLLHPASHARRTASSDAKPRAENELLVRLATEALTCAGVPPDAVAVLASDSDHRAGRVAEAMGMANAVLPELDPASQVLAVGSACGNAGAVTSVAALVLARQQVADGAGPALCISNLDPFHRSAVLLTPQAAAPVPASSST